MTYYIWPDGTYCLEDEYNPYDYAMHGDDFEIAEFESEDELWEFIS